MSALGAVLALVMTAQGAAAPSHEAALARQDWFLNCQGCHKPDASGTADVPRMAGEVARFLHVPGGRDYLIRVPGVAHAPLSDQRLASLVNWMLAVFDGGHVPEDFQPYESAEVGALRQRPFISEAADKRAELIELLDRLEGSGKSP